MYFRIELLLNSCYFTNVGLGPIALFFIDFETANYRTSESGRFETGPIYEQL